jgi:WD40 repeat protein
VSVLIDGRAARTIGLIWSDETATTLAWAPRGDQLIVGSESSRTLSVWDPRTDKRLKVEKNIRAFAISPDGRRIGLLKTEGKPVIVELEKFLKEGNE